MLWRASVRPWLVFLSACLWAGSAGIGYAGNNIWTNLGPEGGIIKALALDPTTPTTLYAGAVRPGGAYKSTTGGQSWSAVNPGLPGYSVYALALDPSAP